MNDDWKVLISGLLRLISGVYILIAGLAVVWVLLQVNAQMRLNRLERSISKAIEQWTENHEKLTEASIRGWR